MLTQRLMLMLRELMERKSLKYPRVAMANSSTSTRLCISANGSFSVVVRSSTARARSHSQASPAVKPSMVKKNTRASGKKTKCMDKAVTLSQAVPSTTANGSKAA